MNYQVFMTYNTDVNGDRISEKIYNTPYTIYSNKIVLDQIPDNYDGVRISHNATQLTEIKNKAKVLLSDEFRVDYSTGMVHFHASLEGATIDVDEYSGIGYVSYPIDRIYSKTDGNNITQTLGDIISTQVREFVFSTDAPPVDASAYKEGSVWFIYQE
jgi:hypothetical protein